MDYLGGMRGTGVLLCEGASVAPAHYDFDGYLSSSGKVTSCGEIRLPVSTLRDVFGRSDLRLRTAEGDCSTFGSPRSARCGMTALPMSMSRENFPPQPTGTEDRDAAPRRSHRGPTGFAARRVHSAAGRE